MSILAQMVMGVGGVRVRVTGGSFTDTAATPFNPSIQYALSNAGVESYAGANLGGATVGNWITPTSAAGAAYEVRATLVSGSSPGGLNTWLSLGSAQSWTLSTASVGTVTCQLTIEIRSASSLAVVATGTVTLTATKTL